jgi:uroporphyrinogen decarboxylase
MCYRSGMIVSPRMFREFMMPYYKALVAHVRQYPSVFGVWVDSDGDVTDLIPLLLECGVDGLSPFEVQAGMDVTQIRKAHGGLVIRGGIDKREIAKGKEATDRELARVLPTFVETGGYVICLDHSAPPDTSLEDYLYFLQQAKGYWS